jgi:uncharacterized protein YeaO (DUF488 family)
MPIRIVQLGSPRRPDEGVRIGAVRRPPRGVKKERYAADDWFDVWYPLLSPTPPLMALGQASRTDAEWSGFVRKFRRELEESSVSRTLDLLAALSSTTHFSLGCYCKSEERCHRSVLRAELAERGAAVS